MIEDVLSFSRAYISSKKERTLARKIKIRAAYEEIFGKKMRGSCATCFIEAMLEIVKSFKTLNIKTMSINYELKRGVLLQELGHPEMACTNDTLTDALAEWHLSRHPEKAVLFARLPSAIPPPSPTVIKIIPPAQPEEKKDLAASVMEIAGIQEDKKEEPEEKLKNKPGRKSTKARK
jgi:hypothetical protein